MNHAYGQTLSPHFVPDLPAEHPWIRADQDRLMQVPTNLLSNAAKFSPGVEIATLSCRIAGDKLRIEIRDRRPGIPPDLRSRIFGKFAQAHSSDTRQNGGTGLGLSIAISIVETKRGLRVRTRP